MASQTMKEASLIDALARAASNPLWIGICAGVVRWFARDRDGEAVGAALRLLATYVALSCFVAFGAAAYLADEAAMAGKRDFFIILAAFVAKDILAGVMALAQQFGKDPLGVIARVRDALRGAAKEEPK